MLCYTVQVWFVDNKVVSREGNYSVEWAKCEKSAGEWEPARKSGLGSNYLVL